MVGQILLLVVVLAIPVLWLVGYLLNRPRPNASPLAAAEGQAPVSPQRAPDK
jgi:hypothetical protein